MNQKGKEVLMKTGKLLSRGRLRTEENKKRFYFILKALLFALLIFVQNNYPAIGEPINISAYQIGVIAYYVLANIVLNAIRHIFVNIYIRRNGLTIDDRDNFIIGVDRITSLLSFFFFIVVIFYFFKISPSDFLTSISLVAVALVLLFKDYISNLMNGMIMMFSDQFHINDYIKVGDFKGRIIDINLANVKIKSDEGELMYIPNNLVYLKEVINYSKGNSSKAIVDFDLNMKFFSNIVELEQYIIQKTTQQFSSHVKSDGVVLRVEKIKKEEAAMKLIVTLNKQNKRLERIISRYCNFSVVEFIAQKNH